jgi:PAS domain S-box-containing protein
MNAEERQMEIARCLFREANDAFFLFDLESLQVVDLNPAAQRLTGLEKHAACTMGLGDLFASASVNGLDRLVDALDRTGFFHSREGYYLRRTSGPPLPVNLSTSRIHTEPQPIGLVVARDISDRKQVEEELRQAEARYRSLIDSTGVVVWELEGDGMLADLGSAFEAITGWKRGDWLGRPFEQLLHPADVDSARRLFRKAKQGLPLPRFELRVRTSGGDYVHGEFLLVSRVRAGSQERVIGISRDVTEQRRLELTLEQAESMQKAKEQAEEASRAKSEFLSNVSHEIRTPLSALLGFAELLGEHPAVQAGQNEVLGYIDSIREHGKVLLALVNDLLDLARIEAGRLRMVREPCSVAQILADLVASFRARAAARHLTLETRIGDDIPQSIATDRLRIHQVLMNLLDNAIKFTSQGVIRVSAEVRFPAGSDPLLQLEVYDTGIGMTSAEMEGLFQPFYQIRPTPREGPHGTGLGLAICQGVAHQLGGELTVRSIPAAGSTFTLTVPVSVPAGRPVAAGTSTPPQAPPPDREKAPPPQINARVLLAEDHDGNRQIINLHLSRAGADVVTARNGAEALARVREAAQQGRPIEAVIMDMEMPVLDGYEAVRQLRAEGFTAPIIAVTAYAMSKDREECLSLGCDEHISKPIDWGPFLSKLSDLLAARKGCPQVR